MAVQNSEVLIQGLRDHGEEKPSTMTIEIGEIPSKAARIAEQAINAGANLPAAPAGKKEEETQQEARARIAAAMDERDEDQILADLAGMPLKYVQRFVYAYCQKHKDAPEDPKTGWPTCSCSSSEWIVDLTYSGIREAANKEQIECILESLVVKRGKMLNRRRYEQKGDSIETVESTYEVIDALADQPDFAEAHSFARRRVAGGLVMIRQGFAREALTKRGRNGEYSNEFPELKAVGKALRNAQKLLISQVLYRDWIDRFLGISSGSAGGVTGTKTVKPKGRLALLISQKYGENVEAAKKAFQFLTAKILFPEENKVEPGSKFWTSFEQIDDQEAERIADAIEKKEIILPEAHIFVPPTEGGKR